MAQLLIRGLESGIIETLRDQAKRNGRSLEAEARMILKDEAQRRKDLELGRRLADEFRKELEGRYTGDSTAIIRELRDSR